MIEKPLEIVIIPKFANNFLVQSSKKAKLRLFFNKPEIKVIILNIQCEHEINFDDLQDLSKITMSINPLEYFNRDEVL